MHVRSRQTSPIEPSDELIESDGLAASPGSSAFWAAAFAFLCFMPYPAYPIGNNSAIQMGNAATVLALICMPLCLWKRAPMGILFLLMTPLCVSMLKVLLIDGGDGSLCLKTTVSWAVSLLTIVAVQAHAPRHAQAMLTGIACATLTHAAVGAWQWYSFSSGVFPIPDLYVNPSFLSVQDNLNTIARWIQRPFGIFPEPSAMSSSLAPFVIFMVAVCLGIVRMRVSPSQWQRALFAVASGGGLALIIVSRSGHAAPTVMALLVLITIWLRRARADVKNYLIVASLLGAIMPIVLVFAYNAMSVRVAGGTDMGNDSWEERFNSLTLGLRLWSQHGIGSLIFGVGPGVTGSLVNDATGISSVFSVLLSYFYDTGLLGVLGCVCVAQRLVGIWREAHFNVAFAGITFVWLIGVTLTTSYGELLPLWIALGWLGSWNAICIAPLQQQIPLRFHRGQRREMKRARVSPWTSPALASTRSKEHTA
jgi:hypothetical protein